ncbi:MAG TPA: SRPBCC domain-containing protein [Propionibacteriaceae bacterium]|nr:SRPBCC domain-containing protein [Propionibacteriaceae bacterium]HPZ48567.1 SRPBCC domain-containing protein [Propionibacteriaceae bacterium]HQE32491.1 SRPBCC domain-containing protein [Propionibacteriaceae bacterium]
MTEQIETEQTDTTVVVSRVVSHPLKSVWNVLMTKEGNEAILGPGGELGGKGDNWEAEDGTYGVTRSFHPMEQIRFSWHQNADAPRTLVDLRVSPQGDDATLIEITQSPVGEGLDPAALESHWEDALTRIENDAL